MLWTSSGTEQLEWCFRTKNKLLLSTTVHISMITWVSCFLTKRFSQNKDYWCQRSKGEPKRYFCCCKIIVIRTRDLIFHNSLFNLISYFWWDFSKNGVKCLWWVIEQKTPRNFLPFGYFLKKGIITLSHAILSIPLTYFIFSVAKCFSSLV